MSIPWDIVGYQVEKRRGMKKKRIKRNEAASGPRLSQTQNGREEKHISHTSAYTKALIQLSNLSKRSVFIFLSFFFRFSAPIAWVMMPWEWDILVHRLPMAIQLTSNCGIATGINAFEPLHLTLEVAI